MNALFLTFTYKICYIISLHRSPSQRHDDFDDFLPNFEQVLCPINARNPCFVLITSDLTEWPNDQTTTDSNKIDSITTSYGFSQVISDPSHILLNSSSCIDLIFTNHSNLIVENGIHPSLHWNCHHQIVFAKLNLKIERPQLYKHSIWNYKNVHEQLINRAIKSLN